jgi:hypothetical protein
MRDGHARKLDKKRRTAVTLVGLVVHIGGSQKIEFIDSGDTVTRAA